MSDDVLSREWGKAIGTDQKQFNMFFEKMMDGFAYHKIVLDEAEKPVDYVFLEVNDAFERMTGLKKESILGRRVTEVIKDIEKDPADWIGVYGRVALTGDAVDFESHAEPLGKWFKISAYCPEKGYLVALFEDITERKKTEKKLAEQAFMLANANDAIIAYDPDYRVTFWNKGAEKLYGYKEEEVLGKVSNVLFQPTYIDINREDLLNQLARVGHIEAESIRSTKDGRRLNVEAHVVVLRSEKGKLIGYVSIDRDVTERNKAEEEIRSLSRFPAENPNAVLRISNDGKILYSNNAGSVILNEWKAEVGMAVPTSWRQLVAEVSKSGTGKEFEEKHGNQTLLLMLAPISEAGYVNVYGRDITERKQAEQALRESQIDLTRAQAVAKTGSWRLNVQRNELLWSDETYRMFGIPKGTPMTYDSFIAAVHPDDRGYVDQKWQAALRGEPYDIEHRIVLTGEVRWVREKAELEFDERGSLIGGFGTVQDITERKDAEQRLLKEKQFSETLINSLPGVFYAIDADARFLLTNNEFARVTGYSLEEMTKMKAMDLFGGEERKLIEERIKQVFDKGIATAEARLLSRSGDARLYYFTGVRIERDGLPILIGMGVDITERKEMENALRETRDYLDSLLNYANAPIIVWAPDFKITRFNHAFEHLAGYKSEEVVGKGLRMLFPAESTEESLTEIQHTLTGEYWESMEIPILRKDGDVRTVLWNSANIYGEDGETLMATIAQGMDITERKKLEEKLKRSERMAAIGETAAMVGHDLRNPLQAIVGFIGLAEEQLKAVRSPPAKKQKIIEPLKAINQQALYMNKIVLDLQDYARPLEPELKETHLLDLVNEVLSSMQIPPAVKTSILIPDNFPKIPIDVTLIMRALTNLFRNAVEAMPEGGKLTIKASQARGEVSIEIMDTGTGIPKENIPRLFTPLFTTKAKGQGFGLPVCKQIIEAHGGSIKVKSQLGKGSTFTLKIPFNKRNQKK